MVNPKNKRELIRDYVEEKLMPQFKKEHWLSLDYKKTIGLIALEIGTTEVIVEEYIKNLIQAGKLDEERHLTLPKEEIERIKKANEEKINLELKNAGVIEDGQNDKHISG